jgi:hypothetical protein
MTNINEQVQDSRLQFPSKEIIYFGHQSVGNNILSGLRDIMKENPQINLDIVESNKFTSLTPPVIIHSAIGKNEDPISKINAFSDIIEKEMGGKVDIAFFKFCYVDFDADTDIQAAFTHYQVAMRRLKDKYPETVFIHTTVPLTWIQTGFKVWIKKIIGRSVGGYADNIKRNQFNDLLRKEYGSKEPLFDLALMESTHRDGHRVTFEKDGHIYYALADEYTDDGGHLNAVSRKIAADQLLHLLVDLSEKR